MQEDATREAGPVSAKWTWPSAVVGALVVALVLLFWLLSEGAISHGLALVGIPSCFLGIAALVTYVAISRQRK